MVSDGMETPREEWHGQYQRHGNARLIQKAPRRTLQPIAFHLLHSSTTVYRRLTYSISHPKSAAR
jgi:hypothetical protein